MVLVQCPWCLSWISSLATTCMFCSSVLKPTPNLGNPSKPANVPLTAKMVKDMNDTLTKSYSQSPRWNFYKGVDYSFVNEYKRIVHHFVERCKHADVIKVHTAYYEGFLFNSFRDIEIEHLEYIWSLLLDDIMNKPYWTSHSSWYSSGGYTPIEPRATAMLPSWEILLVQELARRGFKFNASI